MDPAPPVATPAPDALAAAIDASLQAALAHSERQPELWLFAYASLLWKREFPVEEHRVARVQGWHRAFRMRSRVNRGTPERPGLVFALLPGGSCRGAVYRLPHEGRQDMLRTLWAREMPTGVYTPRWLSCQTAKGPVQALAFTLPRSHPAHLGHLPDPAMLEILRHAHGRYGSTLDYLLRTQAALHGLGVRDREIEHCVRLARREGLLG